MLNAKITLSNHNKKALSDAGHYLSTSPISSLVTCIIISVTLLLLTALFATQHAFKNVAQYINATNQVTLYLQSEPTSDQLESLFSTLSHNSIINRTEYISKEQALKELSEQANFHDLLSKSNDNPLPPVILLKLNTYDRTKITAFLDTIKQLPIIASIALDFDWLNKLASVIQLGERVGYLLTFFFGFMVLFIVGHCIQNAIEQQQQEIDLLKLLGANLSYIRRPFLYMGALLGLGSGLINLLLISLFGHFLQSAWSVFLQSYQLTPSRFIASSLLVSITLSSLALGIIGAWLAFQRYIKH